MADDTERNFPETEPTPSPVDLEEALKVPQPKCKKRVQFHSDENLVSIREIPPRGEHPTTDDDDSGCSDDSDNDSSEDDDEDEDDDSDDDDDNSSRRENDTRTTIPIIVDNAVKLDNVARGSYSVSKTKGKTSNIVAQITGLSPTKQKQKRTTKDRKPKKTKVSEKTETKSKHKTKKKTLKNEPEKILPAKKHKDVKTKTTVTIKPALFRQSDSLLPLRRASSKPNSILSQSLPHVSSFSRPTSDIRLLSVDKVYSVDGFIFPSDPSDGLRAKAESVDCGKTEYSSMLQRKKCFAWQMANGDHSKLLFGTPSILPLWDSVQSYTPLAKPGIKTKL